MKMPTSTVTILGLGSLLSERSSRSTFPDLINFRLGRVSNKYRRVFGHPASIFFQRELADMTTKEMSSLSAEEFDFIADADALGCWSASVHEYADMVRNFLGRSTCARTRPPAPVTAPGRPPNRRTSDCRPRQAHSPRPPPVGTLRP